MSPCAYRASAKPMYELHKEKAYSNKTRKIQTDPRRYTCSAKGSNVKGVALPAECHDTRVAGHN